MEEEKRKTQCNYPYTVSCSEVYSKVIRCTVFLQSDAMATIFFHRSFVHFSAATI